MKKSTVQRAADRVRPAAGGGRNGGRGGVPQGRDQRGDLLRLAQEVRRADAVGDEAAEAARGGERQAEEDRRRSRRSTRRCCRTSSAEKYEACAAAEVVDRDAGGLAGEHPSGLLVLRRAIDLPLRASAVRQAVLNKRIKEIAETRVRYGYRRIHVLLRREGWRVNAKRVCRLYREMGLQLRNKTPKRRVKAKLREGRADASAANEIWAMDFVHDQLFDGRKIRALTIVDTFTRLSPAIDVRQSYRGADVVETLERGAVRNRLSEDDPRRQRPRVRQQGARSLGLHARRDARLLAGQASRPTTPSSNPSTASSESSA